MIGVKTNLFENKYLFDDITYLRYFGTEDIASTSMKEIEIHEFIITNVIDVYAKSRGLGFRV